MFYKLKGTPAAWDLTSKGTYSSGGKVLTITEGYRKGEIKNGSDVLTNIKNAMK